MKFREGNMIIRDSIFYATFIVSSEFSTVHTCKYIGWVGWSLVLACCQGRFWNISRLKDFLVALFKICWGVKKETAILLWMDRVMQYILRKWTLCLIKLDPFKKKISVLGGLLKIQFWIDMMEMTLRKIDKYWVRILRTHFNFSPGVFLLIQVCDFYCTVALCIN